MPNLNSIRSSFEQRLNDNWSVTPIHYDSVYKDTSSDQPWVKATLIPATSVNAVLGGSRLRHYGMFWVQIFVPVNTGTGLAYNYADQIKAIFTNVVFNGINCYAPEVTRGGVADSVWFVLKVSVEFWADEEL